MFGIGASELVVIGVVLLIAVGPSRLPKLLKAVVSGYREFRRATRELRASTGIDEILQDEDLRDLQELRELRKPMSLSKLMDEPKKPVARKPAAKAARPRSLTYTERVQENPPEGVDLAEIRAVAKLPGEEEREAIRSRKIAEAAEQQKIIQAKIAAAEAETASLEDANAAPPSEEELARRVADKEAARVKEQEAIAAKIAAAEAEAAEAEPLSEEEIAERVAAKEAAREREQRVIDAKIAAAEAEDDEDAEDDDDDAREAAEA